MATLVYSPAVRVLIDSKKYGILDVTDDLISGTVTLNENAPHLVNLQMENPRRKYDGVFMPNDRITVQFKRIRWLQVFSGYLNRVPFASVWPRAVDISASCTLKRLIFNYYDPGSIATSNLLSQFSTTQPGATDADGNLSARAVAMLEQIVGWDKDAIHIGRLPPDWFEAVSGLYAKISPQLIATSTATINPNATIAGASLGNLDPDGDKLLTSEEIAKLLYSVGWRGEDLIHMGGIVWRESKFHIDAYNNTAAGNGDHACGLFQMLWPLHGFDKERMLSDPVYAAQQGYALWQSTGWSPWGGGPGEQAPAVVAEGEAMIRLAMQGLGQAIGTPLTASSTGSSTVPPAGAANTPANPNGLVFPVPGAQKATTTVDGVMWGYSNDWGNPRSGGRTHKGHDIFAPKGNPIVSMCDGTVSKVQTTDSGLSGLYVYVKDAQGNVYRYMHCEVVYVAVGDVVKAGQQIALVDNTGNAATTAAHCHFEYAPGGGAQVNPDSLLRSASDSGVTLAAAGGGSTPALANSSAYFPTPSEISSLLIGPRMLMNDVPIFGTIRDLLMASMRNFCSAPNGDLIAWFPDYFGRYGLTGKMTIEPIELLDFTIDWSDERMVTHQFLTGSIMGYNSTVASDPNETVQKMTSTMGVASIEFPEILEAILGTDAGDWTDPQAIMERFGARPDHQNRPAIITPEAEFFYAIHLFMMNWALQFTANVPISFMPELWPGMLMSIPSQGLQVYIEQVTHSFSFRDGAGFDTRVQIAAPSDTKGRFIGLPQAG